MFTPNPLETDLDQRHPSAWHALAGARWAQVLGGLQRYDLDRPMLALLVLLAGLLTSAVLFAALPTRLHHLIVASQILMLTLALVVCTRLAVGISRTLVDPLSKLRRWAKDVRSGDFAARLPNFGCDGCGELADNINEVATSLQRLSQEMETEVRRHTEHIEQKTRSLEILYDVAASINISRDLKDLLIRFLHTLKDLTHARAAAVRLITADEQMRLIYSIGLDEAIVAKEQLIPIQRCMCGKVATDGEIRCQNDISSCGNYAGRDFFAAGNVEMIAVPLQYRGRTLGVYNLFIDGPGLGTQDDTMALLTSIGRHLGMAIEKAQLDDEAKQLSIIQERNMLAHELHDSLAQTLASLRFQVRVLDETLQQSGGFEAIQEIEQIENSLDEAYIELRELIAHFRAPVDQRGLVPSLEKIIQRFREETGMVIFLQKEWDRARLPANLEMQVLRIVQESLANIRKHSQAHTVRVILRCDRHGNYMVLIEDDGVGFDKPELEGHPGEHVGLSIMQERAQHLGGTLRIESEPGEGTRVQLMFHYGQGIQAEMPGLQVVH